MIQKRSAGLALLGWVCVAWLGLMGGASPAAAKIKTATFNRCASFAIAIPDLGPSSTSPNPVASFAMRVGVRRFKGKPQDGVVTAINSIGVRINHTDAGDLAMFLISPGGRAITLASYRDQSSNNSGDGYGTGPASCAGSLVQFGDAFGASITTPGNTGQSAPITGSFRPEQPLSTFIGGPARGFWTLIVQDNSNLDVGQINALSLNFTYRYRAKKRR
jgi:hypothetical protein